ncbi:membrane protein of unknown function [Ruminococcaceae bacterium BL-6]|nr:membrane protein of unknown function [Ruminococcaceae bacterium BL-6]
MNLYDTRQKLLELRDLDSRIDQIRYSMDKPLGEIGDTLLDWLKRILSILSTVIVAFLLYYYYNGSLRGTRLNFFQILGAIITVTLIIIISGGILLGLSLAVYYIINFIIFLINLIRNKSKTAKERKKDFFEQYNQFMDQRELILKSLRTSEVPFNYRNLDAVEWMITALQNKRGNTYTELINLYEQHLRDERQMREIENLRDENERLQEQLRHTFKN